MSLLRDGDGINFQRASYTLDGCIKIYTSRIDAVATETGKLLSGLADAKKKRGKDDDEEEEVDGDNDDDEEHDGEAKKTTKRRVRAENTLANDYSQLEVKKLDLELTIDPLFRKMCADFDEGGAKGLLLNSLMIDKTGRVVFDGDANEEEDEADRDDEEANEEEQEDIKDKTLNPHFQGDTIDMDMLKSRYFPNLGDLDELDICPSLPSIYDALNDPALLNSQLVKELQNMNINEHNDMRPFSESLDAMVLEGGDEDGLNIGGMDYDDYGDIPLVDEYGNETNFPVPNGPGSATGYIGATSVTAMSGRDIDILAYFDETLRKNWAGPEHWKIQKLKEINNTTLNDDTSKVIKRPRKVKEDLAIDFLTEDIIDESVIFTTGGASINLPKSQRKDQNKNLLPDDRQFSSKKLVKLFSKPKGNVISNKLFGGLGSLSSNNPSETNDENDENFWAKQYQQPEEGRDGSDYNADFFNDDYGGDMGGDGTIPSPDSGITEYREHTQLLAGGQRARPEYVNYAKSAKRVNVKLLKDNIWSVLKFPEVPSPSAEPVDDDDVDPSTGKPLRKSMIPPEAEFTERKFSDLSKELKSVYPTQQMSEISTSFCFICVLHLANEKGLVIEDNEDHSDLTIKWDPNVPRMTPIIV